MILYQTHNSGTLNTIVYQENKQSSQNNEFIHIKSDKKMDLILNYTTSRENIAQVLFNGELINITTSYTMSSRANFSKSICQSNLKPLNIPSHQTISLSLSNPTFHYAIRKNIKIQKRRHKPMNQKFKNTEKGKCLFLPMIS